MKLLEAIDRYAKRIQDVAARFRVAPLVLREVVTTGRYCEVCGNLTHRALTTAGITVPLCSLHLGEVRRQLERAESIPMQGYAHPTKARPV